MILRAATPQDVAAVLRLEELLFGVEAWSRGTVVTELSGADRSAMVAVQEGVLVGYAVTMTTGEVVDLLRVGVHPEHRRAGTATKLLEAVSRQAAAQGVQRMLLEVSAENAPALAFYGREGFTEIDRRRRYYREGSDALVLARPLGERGWPHGDS